jgi:hypothetical protein
MRIAVAPQDEAQDQGSVVGSSCLYSYSPLRQEPRTKPTFAALRLSLETGRYGMARPFSPASDMMLVSEEGKERTDVYCDPWY